MTNQENFSIKAAKTPSGDVLIYEFGARLDKECAAEVDKQIKQARGLYNNIVALMRDTMDEMRADLVENAGPVARETQAAIDALNLKFAEAKARDDEGAMLLIAQQRRELWAQLSALLKEVRASLKSEHKSRFFSRIGINSSCATYQLRSVAVKEGLGWGTANEILDNVLGAWKKSLAMGKAPRFVSAAEKMQDTLTLQFTAAGGISVVDLLSRSKGDMILTPPSEAGKRKYGSFQFRMGAASSNSYATGTWQYHRPLPEGSSVGVARLIRRRVGKDTKYAIQLQVKIKEGIEQAVRNRKPLATVHFGWAGDVEGRRVAGIADSAEPSSAQVIALPTEIEEMLARSTTIQGERDTERDNIVPVVKQLDPTKFDETLAEEVTALNKLPAQHIAIRRLHRLCRHLGDVDMLPEALAEWRKADRMRWQSETHLARRARNQRKDFYRNIAINLARNYEVIAIEPLDLAKAAIKLDKMTGEKTELSKKARSGRVVAAIYELESAIRWAAVKTGAAVLELTAAKTASVCSICGGHVSDDTENSQILHCDDCGADLDRKQNGAAIAWQMVEPLREDLAVDYHQAKIDAARATKQKMVEKLGKLAEGRLKGREAKAGSAANPE